MNKPETTEAHTFVERLALKLAEAQEQDRKAAEERKKNRNYSYFSSSYRSRGEADRIPKVIPVTENFSFLLMRSYQTDAFTEEIRRLKSADYGYSRLRGNWNCAILYRGNLLVGFGGKPYTVEGGTDTGKRVCGELEKAGMTPESYLAQTTQWNEESKDAQVRRFREERMRVYGRLVALQRVYEAITGGSDLPIASPDGDVPVELLAAEIKSAKEKMKSALSQTFWKSPGGKEYGYEYGYSSYSEPLPEEWGGDPAPVTPEDVGTIEEEE